MKEYQYHIFSPYRVCPLGAHVDHQHGLVTGFAIDKGVDLWFSPATHPENHVHLESRTFEGVVDFEIDGPTQVRERHWGDYARGAKYALKKRFELKRGIEKKLTERYLEQFPEYEKTFQVFWVRPDDGARFV